jgi:hypothetical protein
MRERVLKTCELRCVGRPAILFFMLEAYSPRPTGDRGTHGSVRGHLDREAKYGARGHVAALKTTSVGR